MLATMLNTITGPAIVNILTQIPYIMPSLFASMAGEAIEFEKPVIGMIVPAPANLPMRSNTPMPVNNDAKKIKITSVKLHAVCSAMDGTSAKSTSFMPCPITQISPPTQNALNNDGHGLVFGILLSTYF
jgi:hypothetical protein